MKAFPLRHGRIIDFEGTRKTGIKQAAIIDISDFEIASHYEYLSTDGKFSDWLISNRNTNQIEFWVAHNASVEKNIMNEYAPYKSSYKQKSKALQWGPWIDTLVLYNRLYTNIGDYSLKNLGKIFLDSKEVSQLADKLCLRTSPIFHQSMFDCVVTFLLINRLRDQIDLNLFIDV
jgi:DNA polymerase III alpha subunit (gram-positive type)